MHRSSFARRAIDPELRRDAISSFVHSAYPESCGFTRDDETGSVIFDDHFDVRSTIHKRDGQFRTMRMAHHIGDGFVTNTEGCVGNAQWNIERISLQLRLNLN